jgi:hypothetical protein
VWAVGELGGAPEDDKGSRGPLHDGEGRIEEDL